MGFDENRFINKTFVKPSPGGGAVPSSGLGKAFNVVAGAANELLAKARAEDIRLDKARGVEFGRNSVFIDDNGDIKRRAIDPSITTPEGQAVFKLKQTASALMARQNAIRNKSDELYVEFKNNPKSLELYEEAMRVYLTPFFDDTNKDIQGMLQLEAEDVIKKSLVNLSNVIEDKEFETNVKNTEENVNAIISNISEAAFDGRNTALYQSTVRATMDLAVEAGFMRPEERRDKIKAINIAVVAGGLFREVAESDKANLPKLQAIIRKRLFGEGGKKEDIDKRFGFDMTLADKNKIMDKINKQANFIYHNIAQQVNADNLALGDKWLTVTTKIDADPQFNKADFDQAKSAAGITVEMDKTPFGRAINRRELLRITGNHRAILRLQERRDIVQLQTAILQSNEKTFSEAWKNVGKAFDAGLFDYHPERYNTFLTQQATRLKAIATERGIKEESDFDDYFNEAAYNGELNDEILAQLLGRGAEVGGKRNPSMVKYLMKHHGRVRAWMKAQDGGQSKYAKALYAHSQGLTGDGTGVNFADDIIEQEQKKAKAAGEQDPFSVDHPNIHETIVASTMKLGVVSTVAKTYITKLVKSGDAEDANKAISMWAGLTNKDAPNRITIMATIPGPIRNRLNDLAKAWPSGVTKQDDFQKWQTAKYSEDPKFDRRVDEIAKTTPDAFGAGIRTYIEESMTTEGGADAWMLVPPYLAYRILAGPRERGKGEKFILEDERNRRNFGGHTVAPFSNPVIDTLKVRYDTARLNYAEGEGGALLAYGDVLMQAYENRTVGPSHYLPIRRIDKDGDFLPEDRNLVNMVVRPLEAYFNDPEVVDALVEDHVRKMLETATFDDEKLPPVIRSWWKRLGGSVVTFGLDAPQRWLGWTDLVREGWIRLEASADSSKDQWRGALILQHPTDPSKPPIILDDHWEPKLNRYLQMQEDRYTAGSKSKSFSATGNLSEPAGAS